MSLIIFLAFFTGTNEPILTGELDTRTAFIGDSVTLSLRFHFEKDWEIIRATLEQEQNKAFIRSQTWGDPQLDTDTGLYVLALDCEVAWYELGSFSFPAQQFQAKHKDGQTVSLSSPELNIEIQSLLKEDDEALAPPKDQIDLKVILNWLLYSAIAILLLASLFGLWYWLKKPKVIQAAPPKPLLPPIDEAMAAMRDLLSSSLLKEGNFKAFYVEIHHIIRGLYGRSFQVAAEEMTSFEMDLYLEENLPDIKTLNEHFQNLCDLVKFAKYAPLEGENNEIVNLAHQIIDSFRKREAKLVQAS